MTDVKFRSDCTVELVDHMGTEESIVRAARVSTLGAQTKAEEAQGLIRFLVREGHGTPLEAPVLTFRFEVPVFVSRQIVKHRLSSINEESGRYRELEPVFYVPDDERPVKQTGKTGDYLFEHDHKALFRAQTAITNVSQDSWDEYEHLLKMGVSKEVARMVLPVNIYSTMYMTANLRSWLNFVKLRTIEHGSHPQLEVQQVGNAVANTLFELFPTVMSQFRTEQKIV